MPMLLSYHKWRKSAWRKMSIIQKIIINKVEHDFVFSISAQCWIGKIEINGVFITLELYLSYFESNQINWNEVIKFCDFMMHHINAAPLIQKAESMLLNFIENGGVYIDEDISRYSFKLRAILYQGKRLSSIFGSETYHYSMLFKLYNVKYAESDDPYGNYHVDVDKDNILISSIRREQT